ncbi:hypothetical protein FNU76_23290 [Chitinimonas arctica]|uniref:Putative Flp pilus-assembly TadG-like N-terminal domain-containing protein n=1 Tax=Chitinimonas arctica TaxID=2594795 RepID=A0A516SLJ9_9NEIS|nr:TadE/TadG family type IV pilus assembly protein [Chitinimonas arctica]QDQ29036.1 hypothetical protein FNU76_23290 [Chitinimonas arctica]
MDWQAQSGFRPAKGQSGQALVFSLITLAVVILVLLSTFNVGQQTLGKMRLQNAADAAVYSAVQAQARDYNFSAYTNRAMVANEVATAQVVGLTSWSRNFNKTYTSEFTWVPRMLTALGGPLANWMWNTPWNLNKNISKGFQSAMNASGPVLAKLLDGINLALDTAQLVYHYGTALTMAQTLGMNLVDPGGGTGLLDKLGMDTSFMAGTAVGDMLTLDPRHNILQMNDPEASLTVGGWAATAVSLYNWLRFTERKDPNTKPAASKFGDCAEKGCGSATDATPDRFAQVTMNSLDDFSRDRSTRNGWYDGAPEVFYITPNPFVIDPTRFIPYQNGAFLMWLWHRGGTELKSVTAGGSTKGHSKKTWTALDATGFTGAAIFWISILGIPIPIPIVIPTMPMGWGSAQAGVQISGAGALATNNNFSTPADEAYGGVYNGFMTAMPAQRQRPQGAGTTLGGQGLRPYFDIRDPSKDNLVGPTLLIEVERKASTVPSSNKFSGGRFSMVNGNPGGDDSMRALASAQAYFARPNKLRADWKREDNKVELGSLYNPYWQTRLAPNSFLEKYASMMLQLL